MQGPSAPLEGRGGRPVWYAADKRTGERIGSVQIPAPTSTAPMTYLHEGKQYIIVQQPGLLQAFALP